MQPRREARSRRDQLTTRAAYCDALPAALIISARFYRVFGVTEAEEQTRTSLTRAGTLSIPSAGSGRRRI